MWRVIFVLTVLIATCEPYSKKPKPAFNKNQRIIKVQGPPHFNHFHAHQKPFRKRPFAQHPGEDIIRPNYPPPIPPFFNGPSTNHVKHPRPPPHVFHKTPSYGLGFPYKTSGYRPTLSKDKFHIKGASALPIRPIIGSSSSSPSIASSTTYHLPKFISSTFISSPPVSHIISSDDNNGPIREIPAPNLAPKPLDVPYDGGVGDLSGAGGVSGIGAVSGIGISTVNIHGVEGIGGVGGIHSVGEISGVGGGIHQTSGVGEIDSVASVGGITHLEPEALLNTVAKSPNGVNLDAIVKDQGVEVHPYLQESGGDLAHGKGPTVEIANFDEGSSIDVTGLIKDAARPSGHHSGYEVTEHHHNHLPSNDQIIKGHDGSKLYYAPDPDPSLPVHKVPPTNDPHSTPSNGQNINSVFLQQVPHGYSYVQGGALGAPLSSQELFHLMHGYPAVISQPVVAFVSQPQTPGVVLPHAEHNYFQQNSGSYGSQYSQDDHEGNDISQYLQQPDIHNLLHNSPKSHHEQAILGSSHSSVISQSDSQQGYTQSQYRTPPKGDDSGLGSSNSGGFPTSHINHNYQYEPDASETNTRNSLTVIRQTKEGSLSSETVKELLLEDSASNELALNHREKDSTSIPTVLQLKNIPEVPFYASLPSKKAAEALAGLQAAGSIASDYMSKLKVTRGDQAPEDQEEEDDAPRRRVESEGRREAEAEVLLGREKTLVEVQQSVPLYETSISSRNLVGSEGGEGDEIGDADLSSEGEEGDGNGDLDFQGDESRDEGFGRRLRPK